MLLNWCSAICAVLVLKPTSNMDEQGVCYYRYILYKHKGWMDHYLSLGGMGILFYGNNTLNNKNKRLFSETKWKENGLAMSKIVNEKKY